MDPGNIFAIYKFMGVILLEKTRISDYRKRKIRKRISKSNYEEYFVALNLAS